MPELVLIACLVLVASSAPETGRDDPVEAVSAAYSAGRLEHALALTEAIPDPTLAAEWRFHVLYNGGGDLPGALGAVQAGLDAAPDHPRLLENAARCALALGLGELASGHAGGLLAAAPDEATRERAAELLANAEELVQRESRARAGLTRARGTALMLFACAGLAMAWLARSAPPRSCPGEYPA